MTRRLLNHKRLLPIPLEHPPLLRPVAARVPIPVRRLLSEPRHLLEARVQAVELTVGRESVDEDDEDDEGDRDCIRVVKRSRE